ncbi:unnamed protein product [Oikopleura dioica]|uniref:Beta-glucuronidase C-terminal domain-containing protein n=1 Tax=Oikopleura dioica TaxID=34765 RepID=E4YBQ3_OIKDI|nr:unnamed protein product [Oikopleura dioica]
MNELDFENEFLVQAAKSLSGNSFGLLRVGGTLQDHIHYNMSATSQHCEPFPISPEGGRRSGFGDGCFSKGRQDSFFQFVENVGFKVIFGLNAMVGRKQNGPTSWTGKWNSSETENMIDDWIKQNRMRNFFALELGNEIYGESGIEAKLSVEEAVESFSELWRIVNEKFSSKNRPKIFGPYGYLLELTSCSYLVFYLLELSLQSNIFSNLNNCLNRKASAFDNLPLGVWMGETGGAYNSGRNTITNRFMSAFWYIDWMGVMAESGHKAFCRQTFIGGNYGLLQVDLFLGVVVNPDFYGAVLFKELMIGKIYKASNNGDSSIHQYYSEAILTNGQYQKTLLILNYSADKKQISFEGFKESATKYILSSPNLQSDKVFINQKQATFPPYPNPFKISDYAQPVGSGKLTVAGHTYAFITETLKTEK